MARTRAEPAFRSAALATLGVVCVLGALLAVYSVRAVLIRMIVALFVAVSLDPAVRWLVRKGVRRSVAVAVISVAALLSLVGFVWSVVPPLVEQVTEFVGRTPEYARQLSDRSETFREFADRYGLTEKLTAYVGELPGKLGPGAIGFVQRFLSAVFNLLLVVVLTIYFMVDLPRMRRGLVRLFPAHRRLWAARIIKLVLDKVGDYMIGNLVISMFAGLSAFVSLYALGVPYAVPLAFFVAITDLIPLIGATLGAVGCVGVAALTVDLWPHTVVVLIFFVAYQQVENYYIAPRVLRNTVDLSSTAVLVAALVGATAFGLVGALMAIPVVAAGKVLMTPKAEGDPAPDL